MLKKQIKGSYIQISKYPREKGKNSSIGFIVYEDFQTVYNRIILIYEELSKNETANIKFYKNGNETTD